MAQDPAVPPAPTGDLSDLASGETHAHLAAPASVPVGTIMANRYRIVRWVASGGMGEVYEAADLELGERVALKTVRPELERDAQALERFRRELLLARKVTHANVCRIFDVGHHRPEGATSPILFLTMEYLPGRTLTEHLKEGGAMAEADALPIALQLCWGLYAAHKAGIVHRDFKSGNVMLVPGGGGPLRAVVTDFGQARLAHSQEANAAAAAGLTVAGSTVGTPAYMSPEQVLGEEVTVGADVYALGVVLFEMVTGRWPFQGDTPLAVATRRLREDPPSPRALAPNLSPRWERAILRCLRRKPGERFRSAVDVARALNGEAVAGPARRFPLGPFAAGAGVAGILAAGLFARSWMPAGPPAAPSAEPTPRPAAGARRAIAVLGFKNLSGRADAAWLSTALAEMLTTELSAGSDVRTVPGEAVARLRSEMALSEAEGLAPDTLRQLRARLGADVVVLGSYLAAPGGGSLRLDLRAQDVASGETMAAVAESGTEAELVPLLERVAARFRRSLGVKPLRDGAPALQMARPADPEVARLYAQGLTRLRLFDPQSAKEPLQRAVQIDPDFPLAHAALAEAWSALGFDQQAQAAAQRAFDLSAGLPREERLLVEARLREASKQWDKAVEVYKLLAGFFPDDLEHGLRLAAAQTAAGRARDALATLAGLRRLPAPAGEDPRLDLREAKALDGLGDTRAAAEAARRAVARAQALGARQLTASAQHTLGWALVSLGEVPAARQELAAAEQAFTASGDRAGVATVAISEGIAAARQGDLTAARILYLKAQRLFREVGDRRGEASALNNLAILQKDHGELEAALASYEQAQRVFREVGDRAGVARVLNNIGVVQKLKGDLAAALATFEQALTLARELGHRGGVARLQNNLAATRLERGEVAAARAAGEEALAAYREAGEKPGVARALENLAFVSFAEGDLAAARRGHQEALALREGLAEKGSVQESRLNLAALDVWEGRAAAAEPVARAALSAFRAADQPELEGDALDVLGRALLELGRSREAAEVATTATRLARVGQGAQRRLQAALLAARVRAAEGDVKAALSALDAAGAEARRAGYALLEMEARWRAAPLAEAGGAETRRAALRKDAETRGLRLFTQAAPARTSRLD